MNIMVNISIKMCIAGNKNLPLPFIVKKGEMLRMMLIICDLIHKPIVKERFLMVNS